MLPHNDFLGVQFETIGEFDTDLMPASGDYARTNKHRK